MEGIKILLNKLVLESKLPIAFYNSKIVSNNNNIVPRLNNRLLINKYKQYNIPRARSDKLTCKVYDIL